MLLRVFLPEYFLGALQPTHTKVSQDSSILCPHKLVQCVVHEGNNTLFFAQRHYPL
jgi:hypothetical protein